MSLDERAVAAFVDAAIRRARRLAALEACGWALAGGAAAVSAALLMRIDRPLAFGAAALIALTIAVIWISRRWRFRTSRPAVIQRIERAEPSLRNLLVTADELGAGPGTQIEPDTFPRLRAAPRVRERVFADAVARLRAVDLALVVPRAQALRAVSIAVAALLLTGGAAALAHIRRGNREPNALRPIAQSARSADMGSTLRVTATIEPPAYTGLPTQTILDPAELRAVEGSALTLTIAAAGNRVIIAHDEASSTVARGADGRFTQRLALSKTGVVVVSTDDGRKRIVSLIVAPDNLPVVRLTAPGRDLIYSGGNPRIVFDARATDDFGLRNLRLEYTKVSGSGEQFEFKTGAIPFTIERASAREWRGAATRALADLALADGDMLVYRAVASDARPGDGSASSDAFFIEISKRGVAAGDSFTLPEEETRYALSQQMLIVKTERLITQRPGMAPSEVAEGALNLAVEQRMIRAEFVFMLGGEVQDEAVEAEESTELQEGRQQNRGQRDVREAAQAMSRAGRYLTGAQLTPALAAERAAVAALQRAFSKDRYILRALATRNPLDMSRRLTGNLSQAADWRRRIADAPANRRAALLQDLLRRLGALSGIDTTMPAEPHAVATSPPPAATAAKSGRDEAFVLAEQALRIDPESDALRQASVDLQQLADTWQTMTDEDRGRAMGRIAAQVAAEAAHAMAPPATIESPSSALRGAFIDALHSIRGSR